MKRTIKLILFRLDYNEGTNEPTPTDHMIRPGDFPRGKPDPIYLAAQSAEEALRVGQTLIPASVCVFSALHAAGPVNVVIDDATPNETGFGGRPFAER